MISAAYIDRLTRRLADARVMRNWSREMSRLDDKWAKAGGVVQRAEQRIEGRLDRLIARETEIAQRTDQVFDRQEAPLNDSEKALDALDRRLDLLSNGGPDGPLPGSGSSQEVEQPPAVPFQPDQPDK